MTSKYFPEKLIQDRIVEELNKLRYKEVMMEGDVLTLYEKFAYDYNLMNGDRQADLDDLFFRLYKKR